MCATWLNSNSMLSSSECRARIRKLEQAEAARKRRRRNPLGLTTWTLQVAVCISCALGYNFNAGVCWLFDKKRKGAPLEPSADREALTLQLEEYFVAADIGELVSWATPESTTIWSSVLKTAQQYAKDWKLVGFVQDTNILHESVVQSGALFDRYNQLLRQDASCQPFLRCYDLGDATARKCWAYRWRRRVGGKFGSLRKAQRFDLEMTRAKVLWARIS